MTVYASFMAALICVGAYMTIPIPFGPVPIVLQNMFVLLAGLLLGPKWGLGCVGVYLLAGAVGFPVFSGGTSGIGRLVGPTGGYLVGYIPCVLTVAIISRLGRGKTFFDIMAMIVGTAIVYAFGVSWLKIVANLDWIKALSAGMLPFLIGDGLKIAAAAIIAKSIRPVIFTEFGLQDEILEHQD